MKALYRNIVQYFSKKQLLNLTKNIVNRQGHENFGTTVLSVGAQGFPVI
jgi:hypothetical protein